MFGVVGVSWWFRPYGPRATDFSGWFYWVWSGFAACIGIAGLAGAMHREDWIISDREIVCTTSFATWQNRPRRVPTAGSVGIRVEHRPGKDGSLFPWTVHFLDDQGREPELSVYLQRTRSVDRFLEALRAALSVEVDDPARSRRPAR